MEDLEGWEVLPDDGFLEIHDDDDGEKIFSRKFGAGSNHVLKNYFICPSPKSPQFVDSTEHSRVPKQLVTVPIQLEPADDHKLPDQEFLKQLTRGHPVQININPSSMPEKMGGADLTGAIEADQDLVSQVSFKKMKEPEFVEMKMDSPRSNSRGIKAQLDAGSFQFDDKGEALESKISSPKFRADEEQTIKTMSMEPEVEKEGTWEENSGGVNLWKWSLTGIGAICSFGVAAATVCIIILGGRQKDRQQHQDNQKLQFHIYAEDKRLQQVVQQATKLNEAISAVRGVTVTRAHIRFGGYYDGL